MLLQLPAPRDYIPVPAPLRTEQRVREDLGPGSESSAAPPEPDSAGTKPRKKPRQRSKILPDTRKRRTLLAHVAHGNQCWEDASHPGQQAQTGGSIAKNSSRPSKTRRLALGELEPLTGTLLSVLLALFLTRIASHESFGLQLGAQLRIKLL